MRQILALPCLRNCYSHLQFPACSHNAHLHRNNLHPPYSAFPNLTHPPEPFLSHLCTSFSVSGVGEHTHFQEKQSFSFRTLTQLQLRKINLSPLHPLSSTYHISSGFFCRISSQILNSLPSLTPKSLNSALYLLDATCHGIMTPYSHLSSVMFSSAPPWRPHYPIHDLPRPRPVTSDPYLSSDHSFCPASSERSSNVDTWEMSETVLPRPGSLQWHDIHYWQLCICFRLVWWMNAK